jgi:geranylgeranyl pyrophosphate synthase
MMPFIPGAGRSRASTPSHPSPAASDALPVAHVDAATNGSARVVGTGRAGSLFAPVAEDLAAVEQTIQRVAEVDHPVLRHTLRLILRAGGKRVRPALVVLAARLNENTLQRRAELAVAAELLHTATLVHDDVLDQSVARRGQPTINSAFSNTLAVLTGDYLFGKSGELVSGLGDPAIMGVFSWAVMELVKGEMMRPVLSDDLDTTEEQYLAKIRGKTASLFAMCCQTGGMLDAVDREVSLRLRDFGMNLGMAFQIADDVLDYVSTEEQLGKPVGSDLRQGTITLPALNHLRHRPHDRVVQGLLSRDEAFEHQVDEAVNAVRSSGAIEASLERAREYAAGALACLEGLPPSPYVAVMADLARYTVDRHE